MADFAKILSDLKKADYSDLHIYPGEICFAREKGRLSELKNVKFTEDELKKIILGTSSPKAREVLGKQKQVNYSYEDSAGHRYRFSVFFSKGKFALSVRFIPSSPAVLADLGLPDQFKKILAKPSGLIIVGGPSGHGKTTTISALVDFINQHFEKNIITVENPVEIKYKDNLSSIIQRGIPLDVPNFFEGLNEAYRLDPDVIVTDSIGYKDALDQAFFLCEAGCMVIAASDGEDSQKILEKIINSRPTEERETVKEKLVAHLNMVICQRLIHHIDLSRSAVFDIIISTPLIRNVLKGEGSLNMLKSLQDQDKEWGMSTFEKCLRKRLDKLQITPAVAAAFFEGNTEMAAKFVKK